MSDDADREKSSLSLYPAIQVAVPTVKVQPLPLNAEVYSPKIRTYGSEDLVDPSA